MKDTQHTNEEDARDDTVHKGSAEKAPKKTELETCTEERDQYLDGWKRAKADLINYKKEEMARMGEMSKFGQTLIIEDVIAVIRSFDLGLVSWKDDSVERKGMTMIRAQLEDVLKKHGVEAIHAAVGKPLDPNTAEAIERVASEKESGTVLEEVEQGYTLHGKVVQPVRVRVAK